MVQPGTGDSTKGVHRPGFRPNSSLIKEGVNAVSSGFRTSYHDHDRQS